MFALIRAKKNNISTSTIIITFFIIFHITIIHITNFTFVYFVH